MRNAEADSSGANGAGTSTNTDLPLLFEMQIDRTEPESEDAPPLAKAIGSSSVIGVFDGLGGAGSAPVYVNSQQFSNAYVASRLARSVIEELPLEFWSDASDAATPSQLTARLQQTLREKFSERAADLCPPVKVVSTLIRRLPTTLAVAVTRVTDGGYTCTAVWAGDSRTYVLCPATGLKQITRDDLRTGGDALRNLRDDSPLSNYVNGDSSFVLHEKTVTVDGACIVFCATDGCFGYLPSPMHFESALLKTMNGAVDGEDWMRRLRELLSPVTGDDCSLVAHAVGFDSFAAMTAAFSYRQARLHDTHVAALDAMAREVDKLKEQLAAMEKELELAIDDSWTRYRYEYEAFL